MRLRHDQLLAPVVGAIRILVFTAFVKRKLRLFLFPAHTFYYFFSVLIKKRLLKTVLKRRVYSLHFPELKH